MKKLHVNAVLTISSMVILLAGCGSGGTTPEIKSVLDESAHCISCHDSNGKVTPGTGINVVTEWNRSTHMTANSASCSDCHDDGYLHSSSATSCSKCHTIIGQGNNPTINPDRDGKCAKCHGKVNPRPDQSDGYKTLVVAPGIPSGSTTRFTHFSTGLRTNYVSSSNIRLCRNCHNPHDTSSGKDQRKAWSESGHGNTRGLARTLVYAKTRGTRIPLDQNFGNYNYCVRCHTSTGFINFVAGDAFTDINALPDTGLDGLPDPNGFRSNAPEYTTPRTGPNANKIVNAAGVVFTYKDTSREATNCNVCHLDVRNNSTDTSSYSGKLRQVAIASGVKIYYPYSTAGYKTVTPVQFDTLSNSNLCLTCHSGRATAKTITEPGLISVIVAKKNPSAPSVHDFAGGAVLEGEKTAFLFYTDPLKYNTNPPHRQINTDGNGPCISCHMPKVSSTQIAGGVIHSHLFTPVSWTQGDINQDITEIISNATVCSSCHNNPALPNLSPASMNQMRKGFRVALLILGRLLPPTFNAGTGVGGWTGKNTNVTPNVTYDVTPVPSLGNLPAAVYTMGASYNYGFLFNEPSSYNHSPILARQLIYDSIDWLIHGTAGIGTSPGDVYTAIKNAPFTTGAGASLKQGLYWTKANVVQGELTGVSANKDYAVFTSSLANDIDRDAALLYLCKDYVAGSNECKRW